MTGLALRARGTVVSTDVTEVSSSQSTALLGLGPAVAAAAAANDVGRRGRTAAASPDEESSSDEEEELEDPSSSSSPSSPSRSSPSPSSPSPSSPRLLPTVKLGGRLQQIGGHALGCSSSTACPNFAASSVRAASLRGPRSADIKGGWDKALHRSIAAHTHSTHTHT